MLRELIEGTSAIRLRSMQTVPIFHKVFRELYGEPCWNAKPGYGSFFTLEFGKPPRHSRSNSGEQRHLSKSAKTFGCRSVFVHGEWHLRIASCSWEVLRTANMLEMASTKHSMRRAADLLDGQKLIRFSFLPEKAWSVFEFDLGAVLRTVPYDRKGEQWVLHTPKQKALTLRADRCYQYMRADLPANQVVEPT